MHDRRSEAAHDPGTQFHIRQDSQVVEILEDRKTGPDGKSEYGCVHQKADAIVVDQCPHDNRFQCLFDEWCNVARVGNELDLEPRQADDAQGITHNRHRAAGHDHSDDPLQGNELVAVKIDQGGEKAAHGQEPEQGM
jgi:hypothetical protein